MNSDIGWTAIEREAVSKLKKGLVISARSDIDDKCCDDFFNPWDYIDVIFGSYSNDFDVVAIDVLTNILSREGVEEETTAHRIFREILCIKNWCNYGTSPRCCFPTTSFEPLLPVLIEKWKEYYEDNWGIEYIKYDVS